mgnify:CR=1 FL=1
MSKKQNYEVMIVAYSTVVVVGAKSKKQAIEYALDEVNTMDFEIESAEVQRKIKPEELEYAKELANCVSED